MTKKAKYCIFLTLLFLTSGLLAQKKTISLIPGSLDLPVETSGSGACSPDSEETKPDSTYVYESQADMPELTKITSRNNTVTEESDRSRRKLFAVLFKKEKLSGELERKKTRGKLSFGFRIPGIFLPLIKLKLLF